MTAWPFSLAEMAAGLRRYFDDFSVQVVAVHALPQSGPTADTHLLAVNYVAGGDPTPHTLLCWLKQSRDTSRAGLAGTGAREIGVYRTLAQQLAVQLPALIAAEADGRWLVLEAVSADAWQPHHTALAVRTLVDIHERFWGLADDLAVYPWLNRPLSTDFEVHVYAAAQAVEKMLRRDQPRRIARDYGILMVLGQLVAEAEHVAHVLNTQPQTLLHGDFRPSQLLFADEDAIVGNWQAVGVGPASLDVVTLASALCLEHQADSAMLADLVHHYRHELARRQLAHWDDEAWESLWDYSLLWLFMQNMAVWAANATPAEFEARAAAFESFWLKPLVTAAQRRLNPILYL